MILANKMLVKCLIGASISVFACGKPLSEDQIKQFIDHIRMSEKAPFYLKLKAQLWTEESFKPDGPWQKGIQFMQATSWFSHQLAGSARIDVDTETMVGYWYEQSRWITQERGYSSIFNGSEGAVIFSHMTDDGGQQRQVKRAILLPQAPHLPDKWLSHPVTGLPFTIFGYFLNKEDTRSFSEFFDKSIQNGALIRKPGFGFFADNYEGIPCIRFGTVEHPTVSIQYWFDPNRGCVLIAYEKASLAKCEKKIIHERWFAKQFRKITDTIWWPQEVVIDLGQTAANQENKPIYQRMIYKLISFECKETPFDNALFKISIPEDYIIEDAM